MKSLLMLNVNKQQNFKECCLNELPKSKLMKEIWILNHSSDFDDDCCFSQISDWSMEVNFEGSVLSKLCFIYNMLVRGNLPLGLRDQIQAWKNNVKNVIRKKTPHAKQIVSKQMFYFEKNSNWVKTKDSQVFYTNAHYNDWSALESAVSGNICWEKANGNAKADNRTQNAASCLEYELKLLKEKYKVLKEKSVKQAKIIKILKKKVQEKHL